MGSDRFSPLCGSSVLGADSSLFIYYFQIAYPRADFASLVSSNVSSFTEKPYTPVHEDV